MDTNQSEQLRAAAAWQARLAAGDCGPADHEAFTRWLEADAAHERAFAAIARVEAMMTSAPHDARFSALAEAQRAPAARLQRRWVSATVGLAATLLLCLSITLFAPQFRGDGVTAQVYTSEPGQTRAILLADGSQVRLDAASEISVRLSDDERFITLNTGRAYFSVAHDATRPFIVSARGVRTRALGTQFQVQDASDRVVVTLHEGAVLVSEQREGTVRWEERLTPGDQMSVRNDAMKPHRSRIRIDAASAWLRGRHVFHGTPLSAAIEEINRYATQKVRLGDPTLSELPVGGNFIAGESGSIVEALCAVLPLSAIDAGPNEIILVRRRDTVE